MLSSVSAVVLAGGQSTRFGSDKAGALLRGRPLLQWVVDATGSCLEVVVVRARGQDLPLFSTSTPLRIVEDQVAGHGPLAGMVAGFAAAKGELCFVTSCDAPLLEPRLIAGLVEEMGEADVVLPFANGYPQPLLALYRRRTCEPPFRTAVERKELKIIGAYGDLRVVRLTEERVLALDPGLRSFRNCNTPESLTELEALLDR